MQGFFTFIARSSKFHKSQLSVCWAAGRDLMKGPMAAAPNLNLANE